MIARYCRKDSAFRHCGSMVRLHDISTFLHRATFVDHFDRHGQTMIWAYPRGRNVKLEARLCDLLRAVDGKEFAIEALR